MVILHHLVCLVAVELKKRFQKVHAVSLLAWEDGAQAAFSLGRCRGRMGAQWRP